MYIVYTCDHKSLLKYRFKDWPTLNKKQEIYIKSYIKGAE